MTMLHKLLFTFTLLILTNVQAFNQKDLDRFDELGVCEGCNLSGADFSDHNLIGTGLAPVSYTHLTLPTIYSV